MEPWRVNRPVVAESHHFVEVQDPALKGPKHDQVECGFFYTNQTRMVR